MTSLYSDYTKLSSYLAGQQFGPKSTVPLPDMNYPILPQYKVYYGVNTLIHDSTPYTGYYNIESGYGNQQTSCTQFMVGSCPSNQYVQPFTPPTPPQPQSLASKEGFQLDSTMSLDDLRAELKKLKLIMFTQDGCKFCTDVLKDLHLKKACPNIKILNLKDKANLKLFQMYGGRAVPFFVSETTKKTFTGHPKNLNTLYAHLKAAVAQNGTPANDLKARIKELDVHILVSDRCGYCRRLRSMLDANGLTDVVRVYRDNDPEASYVFGQFRYDGVPFIVSTKTGKHITGAPQSVAQLLQSLY